MNPLIRRCFSLHAFVYSHVLYHNTLSLQSRPQSCSLADELNVLMSRPTQRFFSQNHEIRQILRDTGRADRYDAVVRLTPIQFAAGAVLTLLIGNAYLVPILGLGFSLIPACYLRSLPRMG